MQICVIDNGYYNTKLFQKEGHFNKKEKIFRSKVQKTDSLFPKNNCHTIEYQGKIYEVGDGAEEININLNKTQNEFYKIITLTGLGLMANEKSEEFKIVSNLPINLYTNENKKNMEEYLKTPTSARVKINNIEKEIKISNVVVFPQSLPALYVNNVSSPLVGVIDIGGLTVQGFIADRNKNIISSTKFSENMGMLILNEEIKKELNKAFGLNIKDYEIESIIESGLLEHPNKSKEIINEVINCYLKKIVERTKLVGWNIQNYPIIMTGGGSFNIRHYITKHIPTGKLSDDPIKDNVKGLWEVAKVTYHVA